MSGVWFRVSPWLPHGHVDAAGGEEVQHARDARFAIDIATVVSLQIEGDECSSGLGRSLGEEFVK